MQGSGGLFGKAIVEKVCGFIETQNEELEAYRSVMREHHKASEHGDIVYLSQCRVCNFPVGDVPNNAIECEYRDCWFLLECGRDACVGKYEGKGLFCDLCKNRFCGEHHDSDAVVSVDCCNVKICNDCHYICNHCSKEVCSNHLERTEHVCEMKYN